jgi:MFS transporter, DHA2 family, multidrug resistance protein
MITLTGSMMLFVNQYLQLVLGLSPLVSGLWTLPGIIASVVGFLIAPIVAQKVKPAYLIGGGLFVSVAGLVLATTLGTTPHGLILLAAGFAIWNLGCAPMVTLSSGIVLSAVPPEKAGSGAAMQETFSEFGFALGIAAFGSLGTAIYRAGVAGSVPASLPADQATLAGDSLAGAVAAAQTLAAEAAWPMLEAARAAFLSGFHSVSAITALLLAGVAVMALAMFRNLPPLGVADVQEPPRDGSSEGCPTPAE